jgi:hypothetical protein
MANEELLSVINKTIGAGSNTGPFLLRFLLKGHDHCYRLSIYAWNCWFYRLSH